VARAGLTRERVADAAAALADERGLDALTLAALAERVGVRQPSLYKHIDSLAGLRRDLAVLAITQLTAVLTRAAVGRSGGDAVGAMAGAYRAWALEHPGRYAAAQRTPAPGDDEHEARAAALVAVIADVLAVDGLEGDDAIDAIRGFRAMVHGFVSLESNGGFRLPVDVDRSFDRMVGGFVAAVARERPAP